MVDYYLSIYHSNEQNFTSELHLMELNFPFVYNSNARINSNEFCLTILNDTKKIEECTMINAQILSMGLKTSLSAIEMHIENIKYYILVSSNLSTEDYLNSLKSLEFSPLIDLKAKYLNIGFDNVTLVFIGEFHDFLEHQLVVSKIRYVILVLMVVILLVLVLGLYIWKINSYMTDVRRMVSIMPSNVLFLKLVDLANGLKKLS